MAMLDTEHVSTIETRSREGLTLPASGKTVIVVALERELAPLTKTWAAKVVEHAGRRFRVFENENVVVICGGIGAQAARCAAEAVIAIYQPAALISAGFAGALTAGGKAGDVLIPQQVIDVADGSRFETGEGEGKLVSFAEVADPKQKASLTKAYGAQAVDMEAASVARCAEIHGLRFLAVKAISDEAHVTLPEMKRFVDDDGRFRTGRFTVFAALRPWLWPRLLELATNSAKASKALCLALENRALRMQNSQATGSASKN
jgi:adenosylhomocysteine nucleosidase